MQVEVKEIRGWLKHKWKNTKKPANWWAEKKEAQRGIRWDMSEEHLLVTCYTVTTGENKQDKINVYTIW